MLILGKAKEPLKVVLKEASGDGPEAFVILAPITPPMRRRAQRAARALLGDVDNLADVDLDQLIDIGEVASRELIRLGAVEWGGLGDAGGVPLELTPDRDTRFATANSPDRPGGTIDLLLDDEDCFATIDERYVRPDAMRRAEKNGLSASPNGTGEAGTPGKNTASSAARPKRRAAAKNARTARKSSRRKPPKAPGTS